jgi:hypothetical protein
MTKARDDFAKIKERKIASKPLSKRQISEDRIWLACLWNQDSEKWSSAASVSDLMEAVEIFLARSCSSPASPSSSSCSPEHHHTQIDVKFFTCVLDIIIPYPRQTLQIVPTMIFRPGRKDDLIGLHHRVHILVEMKQGHCICPLSWSVHCNFTGDGNSSERGWACTPHPYQPG